MVTKTLSLKQVPTRMANYQVVEWCFTFSQCQQRNILKRSFIPTTTYVLTVVDSRRQPWLVLPGCQCFLTIHRNLCFHTIHTKARYILTQKSMFPTRAFSCPQTARDVTSQIASRVHAGWWRVLHLHFVICMYVCMLPNKVYKVNVK
jgi:hypothetical protein